MSTLIVALSVVAFLATLGILFAGLLSMAAGGPRDLRNSNRLMFARVGMQGIAVALLIALLFLAVR